MLFFIYNAANNYLFCHFWAYYLGVLNKSVLYLFKIMFLLIFWWIVDDFGWLFATRIRFIEADPDPGHQNKTDPYGSATLHNTEI